MPEELRMNKSMVESAHCTCGSNHLEISEPVIVRAYCHCSFCQEYNNAPFSDVCVFYARAVTSFDDSKINYRYFKKPRLVHRGSCIECNAAVLEKVNVPLMPKLIVVPSSNIKNSDFIPSPSMHIFYNTRVADIDDDLKKYHGFAASQRALSSMAALKYCEFGILFVKLSRQPDC